MTLLELRDLKVAYGEGRGREFAVNSISLIVEEGERVAIVGETGSGKSTVALAVLGLLPDGARIVSGSLSYRGEDVASASEREWQRLRGVEIGMIPQGGDLALDPLMSVRGHLSESLRSTRRRDRNAVGVELLSSLNVENPAHRLKQYPHELSGGTKQRVVSAAVLAQRPKLIIADEPTSNLDAVSEASFIRTLARACDDFSLTLMFITHDLRIAAAIADRVVVMYHGKIVEDGKSDELLAKPVHPYTGRLVEASFHDNIPEGRSEGVAASSTARLTRVTPIRSASTPHVLEADGVSKSFGGRKRTEAVKNVSLGFGGESIGIVGESGCGKTTLTKLLLGLETPERGCVRFRGQDIKTLTRSQEAEFRASVQAVFQDPASALSPRLRVWEIVAEPLREVRGETRRGAKQKAIAALSDVALASDVGDALPHELSGGQQQRVAIARAIAVAPQVILLDEAVSNLDALTRAEIMSLLRQLRAEHGTQYVFVTHAIASLRQLVERVVVMYRGEIVEMGDTEEILNRPREPYTRLLVESSRLARADLLPGDRESAVAGLLAVRRD